MSTDLASLVIAVDSSQTKTAARELDKLSASGKRAETAATGMQRGWSRFAGALKGLLPVLGLATVAVGIAAIARATMEAEKAQAQLVAVLKSTKGAAGLTAAELNNMAGELQKVTTYGDEAIIGAQSLLLTFTKIGKDTFPDATEAVLNMSTALGQDLRSSAIQVGKALNDPILGVTALGRAGVQFTQDQKNLIKSLVETGRVAEAQRIILQELETQMGGSARAARDTLGGAINGLQEAFGNLLEGDAGKGGLKDTRIAIDSLTEVMQSEETKAGFAVMIEGLAGLVKWSAEVVAGLAGTKAAIKDLFAGSEGGVSDFGMAKRFNALVERRRLALEEDPNRTDLGNIEAQMMRIQDEFKRRAIAQGVAANQAKIQDWNSPIPGNALGSMVAPSAPSAHAVGGGAGVTPPDVIDRSADALADYLLVVQDLTAELGGPLAQAQLAYNRDMADLQALLDAGVITTEQATESQALLGEQFKRTADAIREQKTPAEQMIEDMEFELRIMKLSNDEREREIMLRYAGKDATEAQRASIIKLNADLQAERAAMSTQIEFMDGLRGMTTELFTSLIDGSKSAKEAFTDFFNSLASMIARMIAERWVEQLLGPKGGAAGGSVGGGFWDVIANLFGSFFGGGMAIGGPVSPSKMYMVGERGPEMFIPRTQGTIIPADKTKQMGRGVTVVNNFTVSGAVDARSQSQIAVAAGRGVDRAMRRDS